MFLDGVCLRDGVVLCMSPLGIYVDNAKLLPSVFFFFHSTLFLKFMFLYAHLVMATAAFFSLCTHPILVLHSHDDRHVGCL